MSEKAMIRIRMSTNDAHYAGNLVDGAKILEIFGDLATELLIRSDGDEGLFLSYDNVEFIAPVYAGDFIEAKGEIIKKGNTSRKMEFEAHKVITSSKNAEYDSACDVLDQPVLVSKATGTCVVLQERQRDL